MFVWKVLIFKFFIALVMYTFQIFPLSSRYLSAADRHYNFINISVPRPDNILGPKVPTKSLSCTGVHRVSNLTCSESIVTRE